MKSHDLARAGNDKEKMVTQELGPLEDYRDESKHDMPSVNLRTPPHT